GLPGNTSHDLLAGLVRRLDRPAPRPKRLRPATERRRRRRSSRAASQAAHSAGVARGLLEILASRVRNTRADPPQPQALALSAGDQASGAGSRLCQRLAPGSSMPSSGRGSSPSPVDSRSADGLLGLSRRLLARNVQEVLDGADALDLARLGAEILDQIALLELAS